MMSTVAINLDLLQELYMSNLLSEGELTEEGTRSHLQSNSRLEVTTTKLRVVHSSRLCCPKFK
jgi:hypothetical protein